MPTEKKLEKIGGRPEGGDTTASVRIEAKKRISVDPEFSMSRVQVKEMDPHEKKFRCCMCGSSYVNQRGNFLTAGASPLWRANNGYIPICKNCCETIMDNLVAFYNGNEEHALRHMCCMFDWYYCDMASAMTKTQAKPGGSRVVLYPSKASTRQVTVRGTTFLDTVRDESVGNAAFDTDEVVLPQDEDEEEFVVTKEMIRSWGRGYTPDQYQFLEEQYQDWCTKNVCNTKSQEELYKNISLIQLNIRIAQANGNTKAVAELMGEQQRLMSNANILPKQTADNILADTQTFGTLLKKFEETDPIPEPSESWKDVDGIRKYMNTWVRGGLAKALKINTEHSRLFEEALEEMERYTVKPVSVTEADGANDASIFDQTTEAEGGEQNE